MSHTANTATVFGTTCLNWLQALRDITNATNERTVLSSGLPVSAVGHSANVMDFRTGRAVASALVLANMNSLPLDWAARSSVGGVHLSVYLIKQLPVLPPDVYLELACPGPKRYVEMIVPRVLELTFTTVDLKGFALDLGYDGDPFLWNDRRRHKIRSELDAIFAHLYRFNREELEWILDAPPPSSSFPTLKHNEELEFGEYLTKRYVLAAFDQLDRGVIPNLEHENE